MDKDIYIIRHGQTDFNVQGIVQGSGVDTSLNEVGRAQARAFHQVYGHLPFEKVITSGLKRTHETVTLFTEQGIPWLQMEEINEIGWGIHEGRKASPESHAEYKALIDAWSSGQYGASLPEGESAQQMGDRLQVFIEHIRERTEQMILVCSHGRAMRALMCLISGEPLSEMNRFKHSNTGLWQVKQQNGVFQVLKANDTSHLESVKG